MLRERPVEIMIGKTMQPLLIRTRINSCDVFGAVFGHRTRLLGMFLALLLFITSFPVFSAIRIRDDAGNLITLPHPARRVVTLAPHLTELVYAAGAGDRLVGTVSYSDYPSAAVDIPRVGNSHQIDIERLIALKPDLVIVWRHGNPARQVELLRKLEVPLFYSDPRKLADVSRTIVQFGMLLGVQSHAQRTADHFSFQLKMLALRYSGLAPVRTFFQLSDKPLFTLSNQTIVGDVIRLCGGINVFGSLLLPAPAVTKEAVVHQNPEAIISAQASTTSLDQLDVWKNFPVITAVRNGNLFVVEADLLSRPGPRIIDGAISVCEKLELARIKRQQK